MVHRSTTDPAFLATLNEWLRARPEILVLIRYSGMAGAKDFELFTTFEALTQRLRGLRPQTYLIAFLTPQLPFRGTVDDRFIATCVAAIPDGAEYLVLPESGNGTACFTGESHAELRQELEGLRGRAVAVGVYPPWLEDTADVISAIVPFEQGFVVPGRY